CELVFLDAAGKKFSTLGVEHVNQRAGVTCLPFTAPATAQPARSKVTKLGSTLSTVGGAEIAFFTSGPVETSPKGVTLHSQPLQLLERHEPTPLQPLNVAVDYPYLEPLKATLQMKESAAQEVRLQF